MAAAAVKVRIAALPSMPDNPRGKARESFPPDDVWEWNGIPAGFMAFLTTVLPLFGGYVGQIGASESWGWEGWMLAIPWLPEIELAVMIIGCALAAGGVMTAESLNASKSKDDLNPYEQAKKKLQEEEERREKNRLEWESKLPEASEILRSFERYLSTPAPVPPCHPDEVRRAIIVRLQTSVLQSIQERLNALAAKLDEVESQMESDYLKAYPNWERIPLTKIELMLEKQRRYMAGIEKI